MYLQMSLMLNRISAFAFAYSCTYPHTCTALPSSSRRHRQAAKARERVDRKALSRLPLSSSSFSCRRESARERDDRRATTFLSLSLLSLLRMLHLSLSHLEDRDQGRTAGEPLDSVARQETERERKGRKERSMTRGAEKTGTNCRAITAPTVMMTSCRLQQQQQEQRASAVPRPMKVRETMNPSSTCSWTLHRKTRGTPLSLSFIHSRNRKRLLRRAGERERAGKEGLMKLGERK